MSLDHIAINVTDINKSVAWYVKEFDAVLEYQDETWAMLDIDGTKLALTLEHQHKPHIAFKQYSVPLPEGVKMHRDGSRYIYINDPDGNVIEKIWW